MGLRRLSVLLPCHSLDDFPTYLHGSEATSLLAAWTGLWHPALIADCGALPEWRRADDPPDPAAMRGELVVVPGCARRSLPDGWLDRFTSTHPDNPLPICDYGSRQQLIAAMAMAKLLGTDNSTPPDPADFFALGYCVLQLELLARAMHYPQILDMAQLRLLIVEAARLAVSGEDTSAYEKLSAAFDLLTQARQHFYPVDCFLIDVTLLAPNTWGDPLRRELVADPTTNLLATAIQIEQLATDEPATLAALNASIARESAAVIGGTSSELSPRWMSPERLLEEFVDGCERYQRYLSRAVRVFAQFHSDTTPLTPQVLREIGFVGALLTTFDGYAEPAKEHSRCQWLAADGAAMEALWVTPLDTSRDDVSLSVSERLYQTMQQDHVATLLLAGYSGARSDFYEDWRRSARFAPVLGKFLSLEEYFAQSAHPDYWATPRVTVPLRNAARDDSQLVSTARGPYEEDVRRVYARLLGGLADVLSETGRDKETASPAEALSRIHRVVSNPEKSASGPPRPLAVNAWSQSRPMVPSVMEDGQDAADPQPVPGLGFRWLRSAGKPSKTIAQENRLCNEHVEVFVSRSTGGIQSFKAHSDRRTRSSQRLVFVVNARSELRSLDETPGGLSQMQVERCEITENSSARGTITTCGRLVAPEDLAMARFEQRMTLMRGAKHVLVDVSLEAEGNAIANERSYIASRLLWGGENVRLASGLNWLRQPILANRFVASDWVEVAWSDAERSLTLYPLGAAQHIVMGNRALDTILAAGSERSFRFAIGLDDPHPMQTALNLLTPADCSVTNASHSGGPDSGWFLSVRPQRVVVTQLSAIGQPRPGMLLRLLETEGRPAEVSVSAWRDIAAVQRTDFKGQELASLTVDGGRLLLELDPFQWVQLHVYWA